MIRAVSCFQMPGRSCPREMRPMPIAPTLIRLPGAAAPKTDEGTMAGKPATTDEATTPWPAVARNLRRDVFFAVPDMLPSSLMSGSDPGLTLV